MSNFRGFEVNLVFFKSNLGDFHGFIHVFLEVSQPKGLWKEKKNIVWNDDSVFQSLGMREMLKSTHISIL